jgi:hypothetical protein
MHSYRSLSCCERRKKGKERGEERKGGRVREGRRKEKKKEQEKKKGRERRKGKEERGQEGGRRSLYQGKCSGRGTGEGCLHRGNNTRAKSRPGSSC